MSKVVLFDSKTCETLLKTYKRISIELCWYPFKVHLEYGHYFVCTFNLVNLDTSILKVNKELQQF